MGHAGRVPQPAEPCDDNHHLGVVRAPEREQERVRDVERPEVVFVQHASFVVHAGRARPVRGSARGAGVVDKNVNGPLDAVPSEFDGVRVAHVEPDGLQAFVAYRRVTAAHGADHLVAALQEPPRQGEADAAPASGDQIGRHHVRVADR